MVLYDLKSCVITLVAGISVSFHLRCGCKQGASRATQQKEAAIIQLTLLAGCNGFYPVSHKIKYSKAYQVLQTPEEKKAHFSFCQLLLSSL